MPITELRIEGLRTIEKLRLKLDGLTVLIGENGSGKSSILEACELLRRVPTERFMGEFYAIHGGMPALLREGAPHLKLGVTVQPVKGEDPKLHWPDWLEEFEAFDYDITLVPSGAFAAIESETLQGTAHKTRRTKTKIAGTTQRSLAKSSTKATRRSMLMQRHGHSGGMHFGELGNVRIKFDEQTSALRSASMESLSKFLGGPAGSRIVAAHLSNIRVHIPFEVTPTWAARALDRKSALRLPIPFAPAESLEKLGSNLANAFHALKNNFTQAHWQQTLDYVRLGLGEHIEDVATRADPGGGSVGLSLKFKNLDRQVPAAQLSDGMLAYLAFVALFRLQTGRTSLVALDEPDLHLHPRLLMRVLDMFESMSQNNPVLVATHSDRLLDGLSDPAKSVVLCELDENQTTRLMRPDPKALRDWLERYRGLGEIRGAGHEASIFTRRDPG